MLYSQRQFWFISTRRQRQCVGTGAFQSVVSTIKQKIKVLVADDHPVVRKGLQSCLERQESLRCVGEAADGDEALEKTLSLKPDVVLLDISMPRRDGLAVTAALRKEAPQVKVLILSM